jgi:hypothetical protein
VNIMRCVQSDGEVGDGWRRVGVVGAMEERNKYVGK